LKFNSEAFWDGGLSAFNLFPVRYHTPLPPVEVDSDEDAIRKDWEEVGNYLSWAMGEHVPLLDEQH
jgi:hypothetical protein